MGGAYLKDLFDSRSSSNFQRGGDGFFNSASTFGDAREKRYLVGPVVEVRLPFRLSVEFDALYSRLNGEVYNSSAANGTVAYTATGNRWEFPLLAKYSIPTGSRLHPFVGAGPSFSLLSQQQYLAPSTAGQNSLSGNARNFGTGVTVAGGISWDYRHMRFTPQVRYTRRERSTFVLPTSEDGVQAVVGLSFGR